ncbi:putative peptidyl-tRNA hydrolase PTRHD1 [Artemia franciscana]|uniref:putative peptidyl-tRNA hydrolase PTRHD1 n=1 Tax=Artemia franciscana TaxID=6661 RepID=UPI0032DA5946
MAESIVQYIILRTDLKWPLGAIAAQACHASIAAIHLFKDEKETVEYLEELDRMHKVVLEAKDEETLTNLSKDLTASGVQHKLWIEQPENIPVSLATRPYTKSTVQSFFKHLKLCRNKVS